MDDVRRAYAVLGLAQGTSLPEVRRRYLLLAKRWHPDHFTGDSVAESSSAERMRAFNGAYHTLLGIHPRPASESTTSHRSPGQRLSREEIERMVASMKVAGPIDSFLNSIGWVGSTLQAVWVALFLAAVVLRVTYFLATGQFGQLVDDLRHEPAAALTLLALALIAIQEALRRAKLRNHERSMSPAQSKDRLTTGS